MKSISLLLVLIISVSSLYALDLGSGVNNVGFDGDFGYGVVPCFAEYQFWIKGMPQLIKGNSTSMTFHFKSGYSEREDYELEEDYGSITGYMDAQFLQGFKHNKYNGKDLYRIWLRYGIRMEQGTPSISNISDGNYTYFENTMRHNSTNGNTYVKGDIDLIDNMKEMANIFSIGLDFPWTISQLAGYNNFNFGFQIDYSPSFVNDMFNSIFEVPINYRTYTVYMNRYLTVYELAQKNNPKLNKFSLMEENNLSFRILIGDKVPKYAGGTDYKYKFSDEYSFVVYGPFIMTDQTYAFFQIGLLSTFGFGSMTNNWKDDIGWEFDSDLYMKLHFRVFNIFHAELKMTHIFYAADSSGDTNFLQDEWGFPSFTFYISL